MAGQTVASVALATRFADLALPQGAAWANSARQLALQRLVASGLPQRRDEYWRYTDPASLVSPSALPVAVCGSSEPAMFAGVDCLKLTFIDGVFEAARSDPLVMAGIEIGFLADALTKDVHWSKDLYGILEARGQVPVPRPLAAMNTAQAKAGVVIRVTGKPEKPVHVIYEHRDPAADVSLHHLVKVEAGAVFTLLETGTAGARLSQVTEVDIAENGQFHHVRMQGKSHQRRVVTHCFARLAAQSGFKSFTLSVNGVLTRNDCVIDLCGRQATAHVAAAAIGDGADFHHDDTVFITHDAVGCESRQVFKKVLRNGATGVFQGKILVRPGAQKTDGYQISQALLLDEDSRFLAKPELEIYADDVACSHGSTSGAIDDSALFYLRSRGIPAGEAADLLVLAFLAEALAEVADDRLAEDLRARLEGWLARRGC